MRLTPAQVARARRWAERGVSGQEIARRLRVSDIMISRLVGGRRMPEPVRDELPDIDLPDIDVVVGPEPVVVEPTDVPVEPVVAGREDAPAGPVVGSSRLGQVSVGSRYAGAMLLHAFFDRVGRGRCSPRSPASARRLVDRGGSMMWRC
ncbi:MAG: hypothetical protein ACRDR6_21795 [Pseudonocardiaceae bacterium]